MNRYKPIVKDLSVFKEIAQNLVSPLEILREAISNCFDAEAKNISIIVSRNNNGKFIIEIQDDGKGMDTEGIHRFFNLGDSLKEGIRIGEKGLGTKSFFKSDKIILSTQTKENRAYTAVMDKPWHNLLNNKIPEYYIESKVSQIAKCGTYITIEGYIIDNPEKYFNFHTIKDYILWFTAAGSFKTYFANYPELNKHIRNMQIAPRVFIQDKILNKKEEIAGAHQFYQPNENPKININEKVYLRSSDYCRHFGPFHRATNINGQYVSFQLYGTVSGANCRKYLCKFKRGESLKSRFGIYLAKDFIPFAKRDLITHPNSSHFHLLLNSQSFELTADRNNISNEEDPRVKWVFSEVKKIIDEDILPLAEEGYFKLRKQEEKAAAMKKKLFSINQRIEQFDSLDNLLIKELPIQKAPNCEAQVAILFTAILSNKNTKNLIKYIDKIGHYSHLSTTDMICIDKNTNIVLVEIEYRLSNLFKHEHPYESFDYVVCWAVDLDINEKKKLRDGNMLSLVKDQGEWVLKYGTQKVIPIIQLREIIRRVEKHRVVN